MERKWIRGWALVAISVLALAACGGKAETAPDAAGANPVQQGNAGRQSADTAERVGAGAPGVEAPENDEQGPSNAAGGTGSGNQAGGNAAGGKPASTVGHTCDFFRSGFGFACASGEYCKTELGPACGAGDFSPGFCAPIGTGACPKNLEPVCGCDGVTYANECWADAAGTSIQSLGTCEGSACAGQAGDSCKHGDEYCAFSDVADCGRSDAVGVCRKVPKGLTVCQLPGANTPRPSEVVCDCNGTGHDNWCQATQGGQLHPVGQVDCSHYDN